MEEKEYIFKTGKHQGENVKDVEKTDPSYVSWVRANAPKIIVLKPEKQVFRSQVIPETSNKSAVLTLNKDFFKPRARFKFNSGHGALLCEKCAVIIKIGKDYTADEIKASKGEIEMEPQYCEKCKS